MLGVELAEGVAVLDWLGVADAVGDLLNVPTCEGVSVTDILWLGV